MALIELIDKSLREKINSFNQEYIMRVIRKEYLLDSTVTIFLIGKYSAENSISDQYYIKKELQASLTSYDGKPQNGILGIVLPDMYDSMRLIHKGSEAAKKISARTTENTHK